MKHKKLFKTAVIIKVSLFAILVFFVGRSYLLGQIWFDLSANDEQVKQALDSGRDKVNTYNEWGRTGLMYAAAKGLYGRAKLLLEHGAKVNLISKDSDKRTALHYAVNSGNNAEAFKIIKLLLDNGAIPDFADGQGLYAVHLTLQMDDLDNRLQAFGWLVDAGADVNMKTQYINSEGIKEDNTMIHLAVERNDIEWINKVTEKYGNLFDYTLKNYLGLTPYQYAKDVYLRYGAASVGEALKNAMERQAQEKESQQ